MDAPSEEVSLRLIEAQHEGLFEQFQQLEHFTDSTGTDASFLAALETLADSIAEHFQHEERVMVTAGYDRISGHQWQHEVLLEDLRSLLTAAKVMPRATPEAILVMRRIVHEHTKEADADFLDFLQRRRRA
jgi:hemerythrin-like metal-binding protein